MLSHISPVQRAWPGRTPEWPPPRSTLPAVSTDKLTVRVAELAVRAERKQAVAVQTEEDAVARWEAWHRKKAATGRPSRGNKPADPAVHREVLRTRASADKARQAASAT